MAIIQQIHFLRSEWFYALIPLAFIIFLFLKDQTKTSNWSKHCDPHLLKYLIFSQNKKQWNPALLILALIWFLAVIILAGPVWQKENIPVYQSPVARVIILDLSAHMYATDIKPSRITRAKLKITEILRNSQDIENSLVVFASDAYVVSPLTNDHSSILSMLPSLSPDIMPSNGNNPYAGLKKSESLITQAEATKTAQVILITDHANLKTIKLAASMHDIGINISVLGIGSEQGSTLKNRMGQRFTDQAGKPITVKLNKESLKKVAKAGGGIYITMTKSNSDIEKLLSNETYNISFAQAKKTPDKTEVWQDKGYLFTLVLLVMAIWGFRKGSYGLFAMVVIPIGMISTPNISNANETWDNLWQTQNQQGKTLYDQGKLIEAADKFNNEQWKASALYQIKDYEASLKAFQESPPSSSNLFNIGNTQAQLGEYGKARVSYQQSLKLNPNNQDAKYNLEILKRILDQQKQDQQKQDQQKQDQQKQDQQKQDQQKQDQQKQDQQKQDQQKQDQQKTEENYRQTEIQITKDDPLSQEQKQAMQQWLQQIPDDPGTLLQREFMRQYQIKHGYNY